MPPSVVFPASAVVYVGRMETFRCANVFELYRKIVCPRVVQGLVRQHGLRVRTRIYPLGVLWWLMIKQRLEAPGTLAQAVSHRIRDRWGSLLPRGRRKRRTISARTGGYCRARKRVARAVLQEITQVLTAGLQKQWEEQRPPGGRPVYVIDGSSLQLQHRADLLRNYPPAPNQHGRSHWPILQVAVLHDARSGLALLPAWGPMYGPGAVSEQALAERLLDQLPPEAVLLGDRNFGIFHTAYAVQQRQRAVVVRLTKPRARQLGGSRLPSGTDRAVVWKPSSHDRQAHPGLPADAAVTGRVLVCALAGRREQLYLFTTLDLPAHEVVQLYGLRWNIETDLRSLKQTVRLHRLTGNSLDMMEKEILAAIAAYNLIRTVLCLAAREANLDPRQLSFSQVLYLVNAFWPDLLAETSPSRCRRELRRLIRLAGSCKLPQRRHPRSYPRAVWGRGYRFPTRHETNSQSK